MYGQTYHICNRLAGAVAVVAATVDTVVAVVVAMVDTAVVVGMIAADFDVSAAVAVSMIGSVVAGVAVETEFLYVVVQAQVKLC